MILHFNQKLRAQKPLKITSLTKSVKNWDDKKRLTEKNTLTRNYSGKNPLKFKHII